MSLYNLLFGVNPLSGLLLAMVSLKREDVGRFRDTYVEKTENDPTKSEFDSSNGGGRWILCVYTRNGGGNRDCWEGAGKYGPECSCVGCIATYRLPAHPLYLSDEDDDFDNTYATFKFQIPGQFYPFLEELNLNSSEETKPRERWDRLLNKLETAKDDPEVRNAMTLMAPILSQIQDALKNQEE
jgi:hypothetical protein